MGANTRIEWTETTWNPLVGCTVCAAGCRNCYAMRMAARLEAMGVPHYAGTTRKVSGHAVWTGKVNAAPGHILTQPLRWTKPRRIFVNSMSDLFHPAVPDAVIDSVFAVMALCPHHTLQVLTKRPARMRGYLADEDRLGEALCTEAWHILNHRDPGPAPTWPLPNVWLGTSVSTQADADANIPHLLATSAAVRFLSAEPLLGPVDIGEWLQDGIPTREQIDGPNGPHYIRHGAPRIDWVICGGESGPGRRPMDLQWARDLRDQCRGAGVPLFFKQVDKVQPIPADLMVREWPTSNKRT